MSNFLKKLALPLVTGHLLFSIFITSDAHAITCGGSSVACVAPSGGTASCTAFGDCEQQCPANYNISGNACVFSGSGSFDCVHLNLPTWQMPGGTLCRADTYCGTNRSIPSPFNKCECNPGYASNTSGTACVSTSGSTSGSGSGSSSSTPTPTPVTGSGSTSCADGVACTNGTQMGTWSSALSCCSSGSGSSAVCLAGTITCSAVTPTPTVSGPSAPTSGACDYSVSGVGRTCSSNADCCSGYSCVVAGAQPVKQYPACATGDPNCTNGVKYYQGFSATYDWYNASPKSTSPSNPAVTLYSGPKKICLNPSVNTTPTPYSPKNYYASGSGHLPEAMLWNSSFGFLCYLDPTDKHRKKDSLGKFSQCACEAGYEVAVVSQSQFSTIASHQGIQNQKLKSLWALVIQALDSNRSAAKQLTNAYKKVVPEAKAAGLSFSFSPNTYSFGNVAVGANSAGHTVSIQNTSGFMAQGCAVSIDNSTDFTLSGSCSAIPAGSSCSVTVTAKPMTATTRTTKVYIYCDGLALNQHQKVEEMVAQIISSGKRKFHSGARSALQALIPEAGACTAPPVGTGCVANLDCPASPSTTGAVSVCCCSTWSACGFVSRDACICAQYPNSSSCSTAGAGYPTGSGSSGTYSVTGTGTAPACSDTTTVPTGSKIGCAWEHSSGCYCGKTNITSGSCGSTLSAMYNPSTACSCSPDPTSSKSFRSCIVCPSGQTPSYTVSASPGMSGTWSCTPSPTLCGTAVYCHVNGTYSVPCYSDGTHGTITNLNTSCSTETGPASTACAAIGCSGTTTTTPTPTPTPTPSPASGCNNGDICVSSTGMSGTWNSSYSCCTSGSPPVCLSGTITSCSAPGTSSGSGGSSSPTSGTTSGTTSDLYGETSPKLFETTPVNYGYDSFGNAKAALSQVSGATPSMMLACVRVCPSGSIRNTSNPTTCTCTAPGQYFNNHPAVWACETPPEGSVLNSDGSWTCPTGYTIVNNKCRPQLPSNEYVRDSRDYPVCSVPGGNVKDSRLSVKYDQTPSNISSTSAPLYSLSPYTNSNTYGPYEYATVSGISPNQYPVYVYKDRPHCACINQIAAAPPLSMIPNASSTTIADLARIPGDTYDIVSAQDGDGLPSKNYGKVATHVNSSLDGRLGEAFKSSNSTCACPNVNESVALIGADPRLGVKCVSRVNDPNKVFAVFDPVKDVGNIMDPTSEPKDVSGTTVVSEVSLPASANAPQSLIKYQRHIWKCQIGYRLELATGKCVWDPALHECDASSPLPKFTKEHKAFPGWDDVINKRMSCCLNDMNDLTTSSSVKFDCVDNSEAAKTKTFNELWAQSSAELGGQLNAVIVSSGNYQPITGWYTLDGKRCSEFSEFSRDPIIPGTVNPVVSTVQQEKVANEWLQTGSAIPMPSGPAFDEIVAKLGSKATAPQPSPDNKLQLNNARRCPILVRAALVSKCPEVATGANVPKYTVTDPSGIKRCPSASSVQIQIRAEQVFRITGQDLMRPVDTILDSKLVGTLNITNLIKQKNENKCLPGMKMGANGCTY